MNGQDISRGFVLLCILRAASAQPAPLVFEVASVKVNNSGSNAVGGMVGFYAGGRMAVRNITLKHLVQLAYGVEHYQVAGGPSWIGSERYDIEAKPAAPVDQGAARSMLQALLTERFQLNLHRTTKTVAGYRLLAEQGETKLQESDAEGVGFRIQSMEEIRGPGTMLMLARTLRGILQAPVEDATGLTGKYDISLKWKEDRTAPTGDAGLPGVVTGEFGLSLVTALRQQLGLTLKAEHVPIEVLVIDHAVKTPMPN